MRQRSRSSADSASFSKTAACHDSGQRWSSTDAKLFDAFSADERRLLIHFKLVLVWAVANSCIFSCRLSQPEPCPADVNLLTSIPRNMLFLSVGVRLVSISNMKDNYPRWFQLTYLPVCLPSSLYQSKSCNQSSRHNLPSHKVRD